MNGTARPFAVPESPAYSTESILAGVNAGISDTGYAFVLLDLDTGGDILGITFGAEAELRRLVQTLCLPIDFVRFSFASSASS
ncbi:MAG: hypothetical protein AAFQ82_23940 [Myxococcota bacterium]